VILLDSHVVLWLAISPDRISATARAAIRKAGSSAVPPVISAATLYEIAYVIRKGRVKVAVPLNAFLSRMRSRFRVVPIDSELALAAADIEPFHGDPIDRLITATAILENLPLVTSDRKIIASRACTTIW
jgi:PIN domain nuclease of toxin-antitoxin system